MKHDQTVPKVQGEVYATVEESVDAAGSSFFNLEEYFNGDGSKVGVANQVEVDYVLNKIANPEDTSGKAEAEPVEEHSHKDAQENGSAVLLMDENDFASASFVEEGRGYSLLNVIEVSFQIIIIPLRICESFLLISHSSFYRTCSTRLAHQARRISVRTCKLFLMSMLILHQKISWT